MSANSRHRSTRAPRLAGDEHVYPKPRPPLRALYERFRLTYQSGTVVMAHYRGGAPGRVTHPLAVVEAVEDSRVGVEAGRP